MDLSLKSLQSITFAAFVMAAVDGFMDDNEIETINRFAQERWNPTFGPIDKFMRAIDDQIVYFFENLGNAEVEDHLFERVIPNLSADEKCVLIDLVIEVMEADGVMEDEEIHLLNRLKQS